MRIAIVSYQGYDGAGVVHAHYFANCLVDLGHDVLFLLNGNESTAERLAQAPRYELREVTFGNGFVSPATYSQLREFSPEIVHLWTPRHLPALVGLAAWEASDAQLLIHYEDDEEYILEQVAPNNMFCDNDLSLYRFMVEDGGSAAAVERFAGSLNLGYIRHCLFEPRDRKSVV